MIHYRKKYVNGFDMRFMTMGTLTAFRTCF